MSRWPSVKSWFVLSLAVLLAHLVLLRALPNALDQTQPADMPAVVFSTRTLSEPDAQAPLAPSSVVTATPKTATRPKGEAEASARQSAAIAPATPDTQQPETTANAGGTESAPVAAPTVPAASAPDLAQADSPSAAVPSSQPPDEPQASPQALPLAFSADKLSASVRLSYVVKTSKFPFPLSGELLWRNQGADYSARLRYSILGQTRMQTSQGRITPTGLAPERFADKYRSEVAAHFNYVQGKVSFSANTPDAELLPGAQDRLSVLVQLGALVASAPERYLPGTTVSLQTVGPRFVDVWLFTVIQSEVLNLPGGSVDGLRLERNPRQPYDQKVEVWLSPQLGYLPARVRITETNGDSIDQQWESTSSADGSD
ncbi:DUF3108 domain-containing protein [Rhodoferax antarcticus]|uniref:DUF3108 domain-containing protein n=1 Tax=Rhodoferax antarcticus TaxID=81479 RepID=UPI0022243352|nr:DUF3108 domain-containing protein [Rhodoferax antarcticus]MCW2313905.1 hypothetical protein [Rhodoferax antarcticus]